MVFFLFVSFFITLYIVCESISFNDDLCEGIEPEVLYLLGCGGDIRGMDG